MNCYTCVYQKHLIDVYAKNRQMAKELAIEHFDPKSPEDIKVYDEGGKVTANDIRKQTSPYAS